MTRILMGSACMAALLSLSAPAYAQDAASELQALKAEMQKMQSRINQLEQAQQQPPVSAAPAVSSANAFNPSISAVLNGHFANFSRSDSGLPGFALGEEAGRTSEGFSLDESEISLQANVDDKFTGKLTASLVMEDGETAVELEEAYVRSLGLPGGFGIQLGRFLEPIGYLNAQHSHTDDFADRPLPNRAFLGSSWKDDGALVSWILPTDLYTEVGAGAVRGSSFPIGGMSGNHPGGYLGYLKMGGNSWLASFSTLQSSPDERAANEDNILFSGDSNLYAASLRYLWAPTGNSREQEVTLQGEYFWRDEKGTYESVANPATGAVAYNGDQSGWYAQGVYKFLPQWRIGARYSWLTADDVPAGLAGSELDSGGHNPWNAALMTDWTNSEFSRVRLQYGYEEPVSGVRDNQVMLQYIMALGAHPAHSF